jgi:hypothetical protein
VELLRGPHRRRPRVHAGPGRGGVPRGDGRAGRDHWEYVFERGFPARIEFDRWQATLDELKLIRVLNEDVNVSTAYANEFTAS